ncbi:hypothetical protein F4777DRAFT_3200 [Nemania sp. FL0916]|nr:hypothetical protein F4777DRAFT_3200 [Nemania sp. FL0916]
MVALVLVVGVSRCFLWVNGRFQATSADELNIPWLLSTECHKHYQYGRVQKTRTDVCPPCSRPPSHFMPSSAHADDCWRLPWRALTAKSCLQGLSYTQA